MEENVALDSSKQKKFVKSIKGIKKLIKKNDAADKSELTEVNKPKDGKIRKRIKKERGLVYLSHIPHGFYEHQMTQYFSQFGVVTNARVIRSKRTGTSKGYAFVEFREPAVAEIVAETMNNYLMGKRLIKAAYIPPDKQKSKAFRMHWSTQNNPGTNLRLKMKKAYNENRDEAGDLKRAKHLLTNLNKTKKKLSEMGINYDFFTPVDVPEELKPKVKQENVTEEKNTVKVKEEVTKPKKEKKPQPKVEKVKKEKTKEKIVLTKKTTKTKKQDFGKIKGISKNKKPRAV